MRHRSSFCAALFLLAFSAGPVRAQDALVIGKGELRRLSALADKVTLRGAGRLQQLIITGHYTNDGVRDLTRQVKYRVADPAIVGVDARGLLTAAANGTTEVV